MARLVVFLLAWSFLGSIGLIFWLSEQSHKERIESACYYYRAQGRPTAITIEGHTYRLTKDGRIDPLERPFLNPFHEELLRGMSDSDCIFIDTEGGSR